MRSFWSEPFLWIHLAGVGALPIFLAMVWLGLAVGKPVLPAVAELFLLAVVGIAPVLWMQLSRPFYIFSILVVALDPSGLSVQQRRLLSQFKTQGTKLIAVLTAVVSVCVLWQINRMAPLAPAVATFPSEWRPAGLLLAGLAFMVSNLFLQVPVSVVRVLAASESDLATTEPYAVEQIKQDFTIPGWHVKKILPRIVAEAAPTKSD